MEKRTPKLRLELDTLRVEAFPTTAGAGAPRGTVQANDVSDPCSDILSCPSISWSGPDNCFCCAQ